MAKQLTLREIHRDWAHEMERTYNVTKENVTEIIQKEVGKKFERVLEDAGVYKQTVEGQSRIQAIY